MAKTLTTYLNKIAKLEDRIDQQVDELLKAIDLDKLLVNPKPYMEEISKQFYESLEDELLEAIEAGEQKADSIIRSISGSKKNR
tara:strand:+ start:274 stop:525 length:252 start_codon:yes stop_codon:yes gene_type:complete